VVLPLLLAVIGLVVYVIVRAARRAEGERPLPRALVADLERWQAAGLLSGAEADAILAHERQLARPRAERTRAARGARERRIPVVAEALGYLGGVLATTGVVLLVAQYWADIATVGRLAIAGAAAIVLLVAGASVDERADPALARLRWSLWAAATAAAGLFAGVLATDGFDADAGETVALAVASAVTGASAPLWAGRLRPVQQLTFLGGLVVTAGTATAQLAGLGPVGLAVWAVGAALVAVALRRVGTVPELTEAVGAAALVAGAGITLGEWQAFGLVLGVVTALALLALGAARGLVLTHAGVVVTTAIGGAAAAQAVPSALGYFAQEAGGVTGLVTWAVGAALLLVGARGLVRAPLAAELLGAAALLIGAAVTGAQWERFAPVFGIATSVALIALGMIPGRVVHSLTGSLGLLVNVPWAIGVWFPGEGRAPLLVLVSGALILAVAVLLARSGGRFRRELRGPRPPTPPPPTLAAHP
jgi:hypothetical protein